MYIFIVSDVMIALFGGIAGMIGNTRKKKGNVIPGVAIATALMPPLCTAGYGIATLQPKFFGGAFYLFFINTMFISLSTALVTLILRVPYHRVISAKKQKQINAAVAFITLITIIPSVYIGAKTVVNSYLDRNINNFLKNEFVFQNSQVVQSGIDNAKKLISVSLVGENISDEKIESIENALIDYGLEGYTLKVTQNYIDLTLPETEEMDKDKLTIAIQENTISELQSKLDDNQSEIEELQRQALVYEKELEKRVIVSKLSEKVQNVFSYLSNCKCGMMYDNESSYILLIGESTRELTEEDIGIIENFMKTESSYGKVKTNISYIEPESPEDEEIDE